MPRGIPHFYLSISLTKIGTMHFDRENQTLIIGCYEDTRPPNYFDINTFFWIDQSLYIFLYFSMNAYHPSGVHPRGLCYFFLRSPGFNTQSA